MKLKELESRLQQVDTFEKPKLQLEQYITTPEIATQIVFNIDKVYDDIRGKFVCDLGIGTGMLSIGCSFMEPAYQLGIDIDTDALRQCQENMDQFDITTIDLVQTDCEKLLKRYINQEEDDSFLRLFNKFDTVVMNPPFGTKDYKPKSTDESGLSSLGIDMKFLKLASLLSSGSIYSIHKTVSRDFIERKAKSWGLRMEVVSELKYNIPKIENRNRKLEREAPLKDVYVDFIRFTKK